MERTFRFKNNEPDKSKLEELLLEQEKSGISEKYLRTIIDSSLDGITVVNDLGKFEFGNNSFFRIIGWPKEEIIDQYFMKIIPEETSEYVMAHLQEVETDHGGPHEIKTKTRSGEIKYLSVSSSLINIDGNNKILAIIHDISEKKEQEKNLKESYSRYRELFDNANDGIFAHDINGYFKSINKKGLEILGETEEEVIGSNFSRWLTPDSLKIALEELKKALSNECINEPMILEIIRSDKEHRWIEVRAWVKKDNNIITGMNGIARDITEKLKLEEKLKASEALYKDLFENADDPMYTHDLKGNLLSINKVGLKILGVTEDEIIGSNISKWVTPESYKTFEDRVRKICLNQPLEELVIMEVITKNGEHKWGEARTRLLKDGNKIIGTHGIMRDITEKMRLEKELKESEEKYRDLFENAQDAMYVLDNEANFLKMNQVGLQILGCTKEEVIGKNISKWISKESLRIVEERRKKRLSGEKLERTDTLEIVCKNGEHRWAEIKTREIKYGDRTREIHGIARDITENILLKNELKKSNKQQKLLCYLIQGTRGGKTRALILKHLADRSYNANQLATAMNMDYKTIRHHLNVLIKNGIIGKGNDGYSDLYFISDNSVESLYSFSNNTKHDKIEGL